MTFDEILLVKIWDDEPHPYESDLMGQMEILLSDFATGDDPYPQGWTTVSRDGFNIRLYLRWE